jgi:hypothetical protein
MARQADRNTGACVAFSNTACGWPQSLSRTTKSLQVRTHTGTEHRMCLPPSMWQGTHASRGHITHHGDTCTKKQTQVTAPACIYCFSSMTHHCLPRPTGQAVAPSSIAAKYAGQGANTRARHGPQTSTEARASQDSCGLPEHHETAVAASACCGPQPTQQRDPMPHMLHTTYHAAHLLGHTPQNQTPDLN